MKELNDLFQNLYKNFILRDLLSFILPGSIITFSLFYQHIKQAYWHIHNELSFVEDVALLTLLFAMFFMVGFTIQCLGAEVLNIVLFYHKGKFKTPEHLYEYMTFIRESCAENVVNRIERFIAIMQMCGNCSLALLTSSMYLYVKHVYKCSPEFCLFLIIAIVSYAIIAWWGLKYCQEEKSSERKSWPILIGIALPVITIICIWDSISLSLFELDMFILVVAMLMASLILLVGHYKHVERFASYLVIAKEMAEQKQKQYLPLFYRP